LSEAEAEGPGKRCEGRRDNHAYDDWAARPGRRPEQRPLNGRLDARLAGGVSASIADEGFVGNLGIAISAFHFRMIPIRDVIPSRTTPGVTIGLIALNTLVFLYQISLGDEVDRFILQFALIPAGFSWATVFSSMFVHGGLLHFGGNMLYLWIFGDNVEDRMGHGRFLGFYLLCGMAAAVAQSLLVPESTIPMVGASGAIAGVMGAYFLLYPRSRIVTLVPLFFFIQLIEIPAVFFLGVWFLMQLLSGVGSIASATAGRPAGGIAFWAHVAGFATGAAGVLAFRRRERQQVEWWHG
jgi:membrane associated rhomboid family serine protease